MSELRWRLRKWSYPARRRLAWWLWGFIAPESNSPGIRPNPGAAIDRDRCEDADEVFGAGFLHVEQMDTNLYWARLDTGIEGKDVVMWFRAKGNRITLVAEFD